MYALRQQLRSAITSMPPGNIQLMHAITPLKHIPRTICEFQAPSEGRVVCMFEGIRMLKPSAAVDTIIPGIWECQWSSFKSFWPCLKSKHRWFNRLNYLFKIKQKILYIFIYIYWKERDLPGEQTEVVEVDLQEHLLVLLFELWTLPPLPHPFLMKGPIF